MKDKNKIYTACGVVLLILSAISIVMVLLFDEKIIVRAAVVSGITVINLLFYFWYMMKESRRVMRRQNERILNGINGGIVSFVENRLSGTKKVEYISPFILQTIGYDKTEIERVINNDLYEMFLDEDIDAIRKEMAEAKKKRAVARIRFRIKAADDTFVLVYMVGEYSKFKRKNVKFDSVVLDISNKEEIERESLFKERIIRLAIDQTQNSIFDFNFTSGTFNLIINASKVTGYTEHEMKKKLVEVGGDIKQLLLTLVHETDKDTVEEMFQQLKERSVSRCELRIKNKGGKFKWCLLYCTLFSDSNGVYKNLIGSLGDIDNLKRVNETLEKEVRIDPMTEIYNKVTMRNIINGVLISESAKNHALMVIDIDDFKNINDSFGHLYGDSILIKLATKLKRVFRSYDVVGRVGGDEFAVFMRNAGDVNSTIKKANEVNEMCRKIYTGSEDCRISCSIGVAFSNGKTDYEEIFNNADKALYQAKSNGKNGFWIYSGLETVDITNLFEDTAEAESSEGIWGKIFGLISDAKDFDSSINMILSLLGEYNSPRGIIVFEVDEEENVVKPTYEWWSNDSVETDSKKLLRIDELTEYFKKLETDGAVIYDNENCPELMKKYMNKFGYKIVFQIASKVKGKIRLIFNYVYESAASFSVENGKAIAGITKVVGNYIYLERREQALAGLKKQIETKKQK